jgi:hypothetical protein
MGRSPPSRRWRAPCPDRVHGCQGRVPPLSGYPHPPKRRRRQLHREPHRGVFLGPLLYSWHRCQRLEPQGRLDLRLHPAAAHPEHQRMVTARPARGPRLRPHRPHRALGCAKPQGHGSPTLKTRPLERISVPESDSDGNDQFFRSSFRQSSDALPRANVKRLSHGYFYSISKSQPAPLMSATTTGAGACPERILLRCS